MRVLALILLLLLPAPVSAQAIGWTEAHARATLAAVEGAKAEGLNPADYGADALRAALAAAEPQAIAAAAEASWMALARDYAAGRTDEGARRQWKGPAPRSDPAWLSARLAEGLAAGSPASALAALLPTHPTYGWLKQALATARDPAEAQAIKVNLERWRWLPRLMGERYLLANVPAHEVDLWDGGALAARHRIIVGRPKTPTVQFSAAASAVIFNPPWVVPESIVKESIGSLIRRSPSAARAKGYSWTSDGGTLTVTQAPGPGNSLGKVKIEMPNPYAIYFHDTPAKQLFQREARALSHGCMRTQGIAGLALRLLDAETGWDAAAVDAAMARTETERVPLTAQVPVHVGYFTVSPGKGGVLRRHPDIYGLDAEIAAALARGRADQAIPNRPA